MHQFIAAPNDVIALKVAGRLTGADIGATMDRLEAVMAAHPTVHVFVQTEALDGIEIGGLPAQAARALPLLGKLKRFGRIAVVADQAWVRVGARVKSALLPWISFRTFRPEEREAALAWVAGAQLTADADARR
jgi:hypothetical protein